MVLVLAAIMAHRILLSKIKEEFIQLTNYCYKLFQLFRIVVGQRACWYTAAGPRTSEKFFVVSHKLANFFILQRNSAKMDISHIFCLARFIF